MLLGLFEVVLGFLYLDVFRLNSLHRFGGDLLDRHQLTLHLRGLDLLGLSCQDLDHHKLLLNAVALHR